MSSAAGLLGLSQGVPVGALILALDAPNPIVSGAAEYLRMGTIKTYSATYAAAIAAAPQLRVFGSDPKTYGTTIGLEKRSVYHVGVNYLSIHFGSNVVQYGSSLSALSSSVVVSVPELKRVATIGSSYLVAPALTANTPPNYTANGSTFAAVGGTFTTCPAKTAIASDNVSKWITLSSLTGTGGEQAYLSASNPSGSWTVGAGTILGMTSVQAVAISPTGVVVAAGNSISATTGKLASCPALGGTWVDRTPSSVTFTTNGNVEDVVHDGTEFIALAYSNLNKLAGIITSPDGTTWTNRGVPCDLSQYAPLTGDGSWASSLGGFNANTQLTTDRAGTVILTLSAASLARPVFFISTDHGATWAAAQSYIGKVAPSGSVRTMSYANGRWIYNHSGHYQSVIDLGPSLATPDYIGQQLSLAAGQYVRIK